MPGLLNSLLSGVLPGDGADILHDTSTASVGFKPRSAGSSIPKQIHAASDATFSRIPVNNHKLRPAPHHLLHSTRSSSFLGTGYGGMKLDAFRSLGANIGGANTAGLSGSVGGATVSTTNANIASEYSSFLGTNAGDGSASLASSGKAKRQQYLGVRPQKYGGKSSSFLRTPTAFDSKALPGDSGTAGQATPGAPQADNTAFDDANAVINNHPDGRGRVADIGMIIRPDGIIKTRSSPETIPTDSKTPSHDVDLEDLNASGGAVVAKGKNGNGSASGGNDANGSNSANSVPAAEKALTEASKTATLKLPDKPAVRVDMLNNNNSQYYGDFFLGTPPKPFTAVLDTGSGLIWVPGAECQSKVCNDHHRFDAAKSSTFNNDNLESGNTTSIHYGTGEVHYATHKDTLSFCDSKLNPNCRGIKGGDLLSTKEEDGDFSGSSSKKSGSSGIVKIPNQPFGTSLSQSSEPFKWLPFDGILGLAPSASSTSVMHYLKQAKTLAHNMLGVYLSEDTHRVGSLSFGGIEPQYIAAKHPLYWHTITHPKEWQVSIVDLEINGKRMHVCDGFRDKVCPAVVDTGSSLFTGPSAQMDPIVNALPVDQKCRNLHQMPDINVLIKGDDGIVKYPLTSEEYTLRTTNETTDDVDCELGIGSMDVPGSKWVIGDTFLRRYYSIYDDDAKKVGFVRSVHAGEEVIPEAKNLLLNAKSSVIPRVAIGE